MLIIRKIFITTICSSALLACTQNPVVVENKGYSVVNIDNRIDLEKNPFKVKVTTGDNLYKISKQYGVGIRDLIEINRLAPPYILVPNQVLKLPQARFHLVDSGDTIFAISRSYGVDMGRLVHENNLKKPYTINKGMKLRIPSTTLSYDNSSKVVAATSKDEVQEKGQRLAKVVESDLKELDLGVEKPKFVLPKKLNDNNNDEFSRSLFNGEVGRGTPRPHLRSSLYPVPAYKPGNKVATTRRYQKASYSYQPLKTGGRSFSWPTSGRVVSRFGPKKGGLYNDGINISAREGAAIKAASDGIVVYAGNELRGYGNLVLVKHNNGYVTAYAHAKDFVVSKGEQVKKGQKIGSVGKTGHVGRPQLHFSIRKGRKAIDPQKYLPNG